MSALIQITTGEQGSPVVSARELYDGLGFDSSQWSRWHKKNIQNNPFAKEGEDWQALDIMSNGNQTVDYAITTDFAKRLCMMARTEQGEKFRQYFIECERKLQEEQRPVLTTTEQLMLQLVQQNTAVLANQQTIIERLQSDIADIRRGLPVGKVRKARQLALPVGIGVSETPPSDTKELRRKINYYVNEYCDRFNAKQQEAYRYLYKRMRSVFGFDPYQLTRDGNDTVLDAVERYGQLDRLYSLVMAELAYKE